jgi:uncharacterized membrane protein YcaP (DUF421 family)
MPATEPLGPRKAHPSEFQILPRLPNLPQELRSTQVILRFFVRMIVLVVFANFGGIGFGRSLAALLWMSTILSAVIGAVRREPLLDAVLNHWDETVAYAALFCLVMGFDQALPL